MKKILKNIIFTLAFMFIFGFTSNASESSSIMSQEEIQEILNVDADSVLTEDEHNKIMENMDYLLEAETDEELEERIEEKGFEELMEIVDEPYNETIKKEVRLARPNSFSADFTNRSITSTMFSVRLMFYNYLPRPVTQCAGYVGYEYKSPSGKKLIIKPQYVNELFMATGSVRTVGKYSYQHNNKHARYVASLVLNIGPNIPKASFTVEENKW